jgi:D-sedoheptulose 7-phosphate isomerase
MTAAEAATDSSAETRAAKDPGLRDTLRSLATSRFDRSIEAPQLFFDTNADAIARATLAMARRFRAGGRLLVFGDGANATDAQHVSVEFVHPVIVGKRALPAIALVNDIATVRTGPHSLVQMLATLGRQDDIALGIHGNCESQSITQTLARARSMGMLTVAIASDSVPSAATDGCDHVFLIQDEDPLVVQEVAETTYHILWELVHVFLDHLPDESSGRSN